MEKGKREKKRSLHAAKAWLFKLLLIKPSNNLFIFHWLFLSSQCYFFFLFLFASRGVPPSLVSSSSHHYGSQILHFPPVIKLDTFLRPRTQAGAKVVLSPRRTKAWCLTAHEPLHATWRCVSSYLCVWVDRRAAVYTDGQMSGAGEQQMPEVTPPAAFHWTTGFHTKAGAAPNIKYTCLCLDARGHYFVSPSCYLILFFFGKTYFNRSVLINFAENCEKKKFHLAALGSCFFFFFFFFFLAEADNKPPGRAAKV